MKISTICILIALAIIVGNTILVQTPSTLAELQQRIASSFQQQGEVEHGNITTSEEWSQCMLYDQTLNWSTTVTREWEGVSIPSLLTNKQRSSSKQPAPPPAMLLLTSFGWNQPNQTAGLEIYRGIRTRRLVNGVINHPWFHPTAWNDIQAGTMPLVPGMRYYVFLDREICGEKNYPNYMEGMHNNRDEVGGRKEEGGWREHNIHEIMNSTVMSARQHSKFVLFDCGGHGPKPHYQMDRLWYNTSQLVFASISALQSQHQRQDLGLPPPAIRPYELTDQDRLAIRTCEAETTNRTTLVSYSGQLRSPVRKVLAKLDNQTVLENIAAARNWSMVPKLYIRRRPTQIDTKTGNFLHELALDSVFSLAPRGDNLFSYRLPEVMSCGSIPVVMADKWVLPFSPLLMNWSDSIVILPQDLANQTVEILQSMPLEERCRRRQRVVELYDKYLKTGEGTIAGIVESLELQAAQDAAEI
jgi:hypothetical protein